VKFEEEKDLNPKCRCVYKEYSLFPLNCVLFFSALTKERG